ncbi:uncharacterized protein DC041_0011064 [Schistosoma bovis]|uniref:Uncharacterized protein n=1 Tax=Schistosoma bovis TaxID=6184 RepID=A0A430Q643_SCHBO|nr:uncharacterized protein DC041_0011064 [Schistosoma bovis]
MVVTRFKDFPHVRPLVTTAVVLWICVIIYLSSSFFNLESSDQQSLACQNLLDVITGLKSQVDIGSANLRIFLTSYNAKNKKENTIVKRGFKDFPHVRPLVTTAVVLWICVIIYLSSSFFNLESSDQQSLACQNLLDVITGLKSQVDIGSANLRIFLTSYNAKLVIVFKIN